MPGSMPYSLEKGPYLSVIEDYVNGDRERALTALTSLRNGDAIDQLEAFDSQPLDAGPYSTTQLRDHFKQDWLGYKPDGQGGWLPPPPFDALTSPTTGFWQAWHGDCEGVLRLTLIRALEVSLGIPHTQAAGGERHAALADRAVLALPHPVVRGMGHVAGEWQLPEERPGHGAPLDAQPRPPAQEHAVADQRRPRLRRGPAVRRRFPRLVGRQPAVPPAPQDDPVTAQPGGHRDVPDPWPRLQQRGNTGHREPGGVGGRRAEPTHTMATPRVLTAGGRRCRRQTLRWSWSSRT